MCMTDKFDIIEYLSGLTTFVFDKATLKVVAYERGVNDVMFFDELDSKTKDLLKADLLYIAYMSPNVWASYSQSHGNYTNSYGPQTLYEGDRERLYNAFISIYTKYNDAKLEEAIDTSSNLQWLS